MRECGVRECGVRECGVRVWGERTWGERVCAKLKTLALAPSPVHPFPAHRWVTVLDSNGNSVVMRSLIKELHAVALSSDGRGKMDGDHLKEGISCREPATHDCL